MTSNEEGLLSGVRVYGPCVNPEGRKVVVFHDNETGKRTSQSYPRFLMEQHLGRKLGFSGPYCSKSCRGKASHM